MKHFKHMQAKSADEAANEAANEAADGEAWVMAGGTDLLGTLKDEIFPEYPKTVVDLKTISGMDGISEDGDALRIGALAKLVRCGRERPGESSCCRARSSGGARGVADHPAYGHARRQRLPDAPLLVLPRAR